MTLPILAAILFPALASGVPPAPSAAPVSLSGTGVRLTAESNGVVHLQDSGGAERMTFGDYRLVWGPPETDGGVASVSAAPDGQKSLRVVYRVKNAPAGTMQRIEGTYTVSPYRVHLRYDVWGADDLQVAGAMLTCRAVSPRTSSRLPLAHWERDPNGGVPFEAPDGTGRAYEWADKTRLVVSLENSNAAWSNDAAMHFPPKKLAGEKGHFVAEGDVFLLKARPSAAGALKAGRPFALDLWTDQPFNLWESASRPLRLHAELANTAATAQATTITYRARDFNGAVVAQGSVQQTLAPRGTWNRTLTFPAPTRGLLFVEVEARAGANAVFSRTTLGVLPRYAFKAGDESLFGISSYFPEPSPTEAQELLKRIGVRWLRQKSMTGADAERVGLRQNYHSNIALKAALANTAAQNAAWVESQLKEADAVGAPFWEVCNEWNGEGGFGSGAAAAPYAEKVLIPADNARKATGAKVKLMSLGLAGGDPTFIDNMYKAGAWDHFDAFALHPGRGNFTPDFTGEPGIVGKQGEYWNFLGTIRGVKDKLDQYGTKPLWITEAYACTAPNSWWHDTPRHAAENVVLSYALAASEGVRVMDWYQLNDTVWWNVGAANPDDSEFHYGMLNRDLSPKPSLFAYETIAQALDQAKFVRQLTFPDPKQHGLLFDTPRGPMTVLWHRADGYALNMSEKRIGNKFVSPEAWQDDWKTRVRVTFPAAGTEVREIDCIGQETLRKVQNGRVTLTLDGAPRIYYGLSNGGNSAINATVGHRRYSEGVAYRSRQDGESGMR